MRSYTNRILVHELCLKHELLSLAVCSKGSIKDTSEHKNLLMPKLQQLEKTLHDWFVMKW
jgi:hypothetical protein